jgi:glycosyltransferase involved in cell wall biosynthesis
MKIVVDARYLSSTHSGIGVYSRQLLEHLALIDTANEYIVVTHASYDHKMELGENFRVVTSDARPLSIKTFRGAIDDILEEEKPDLLHSTFPLVPLRWEGPQMITLHDLQPFTVQDFTSKRPAPIRFAYDMFYRWAYQRAFNQAHCIVSVSQSTKDELHSLYPKAWHRTLVVPSGLDPAFFESVNAEARENVQAKYRLPEQYIHYVGSTRPNKNLPQMLLAFAEFRHAHPDTDLNFVLVLKKDRFYDDAKKMIETYGIKNHVRVLDQVTFDELRIIYAGSQALFFVTKSEGFGFPVLEAQASGVPVIASTDGALPYVAGEGALLTDPDDSTAILQSLTDVLENDELRQILIQAGTENCRRFTWEQTAQHTLDIYQDFFNPAQFEVVRRVDDTLVSATNIGGV